ncbi:MAG TPA: hypothetical protein VGD37_25275 [Kofleriaceae bacterium]
MSSLLVAASVAAGPDPKDPKADKKAPAAAGATAKKTPAGASGAAGAKGAKGAATPATPANAGPDSSGASGAGGPGNTGGTDGAAPSTVASAPDLSAVKPEDMPTAVRMRRLEQRTQALKERAWQLKARVQMLQEQMIGGGVGAQAVVAHANEMGASFRLIKLIYSLDGTQVFARTDDAAESLYKSKGFDVFAGPISPGNHSLSVVATYRGHGYGVFEYLSKYTFTAHGNQAFIAGEGKISKVDCRAFEKGGPTMPLEKRATVECKVTQVQPEKPPGEPGETPAKPGETTPRPGPAAAAPPAPAPAAASPATGQPGQPGK